METQEVEKDIEQLRGLIARGHVPPALAGLAQAFREVVEELLPIKLQKRRYHLLLEGDEPVQVDGKASLAFAVCYDNQIHNVYAAVVLMEGSYLTCRNYNTQVVYPDTIQRSLLEIVSIHELCLDCSLVLDALYKINEQDPGLEKARADGLLACVREVNPDLKNRIPSCLPTNTLI